MSADRQQTAARTPRPMHDSGPSDPSDETPGRLRDAIENSRLEVAKLGVRIAGVEERIESGRSAAQSLWWLAGAAVLLGFLTVSLTWQVSRRAAEIRAAVRSTSALVERSAQATDAAFTRIDAAFAGQAAAAEKLAAAIAGLEATGQRMQAALVDLDQAADRTADATVLIGRQLADTTLRLATLRGELDEHFREHRDAIVAGRGEMLAALTSSICRVESDLHRQAEELMAQRAQVDASTSRMRQTQQRMLGEATHAVAAQLEGLRRILAGLEGEFSGGEVADAETAAEAAGLPGLTEADPAITLDAGEQADAEPAAEVGENVDRQRK